MPDYDGTGPLKRGRLIGRERGPCRQGDGNCARKTENDKPLNRGGMSGG